MAGGEIHWGDEPGLRSDDVRGRSYAPRGDTPAVRPNHRRENVGVISIVINRDTVRRMVLGWAINTALLIDFMQRLVHDVQRRCFCSWST